MPVVRPPQAEDSPAFAEVEGEVRPSPAGGRNSVFSTARDQSSRAASTREPVLSEQPFADDSAEANGGPPSRLTHEQILDRVVIPDEGHFQNLPRLVSPELRLTGRCVALRVKQHVNGCVATNYYYTGLVSTVTANAVTLMHVNRYTHADFKAYQVREHRQRKDRREEHSRDAEEGQARSFDANEVLTDTQDAVELHDAGTAGSLAPATALTTEAALCDGDAPPPAFQRSADAGVAERVRPRRFRTFDGSVGPIPYVTFLRKSINDVEFGRDPRSAFYALFQDPARAITDMQYLRMFVRRYLVHTSEHNNPFRLPIYAFLSRCLRWSPVDRELVNQLVREELRHLMQADSGLWTASNRRLGPRDSSGADALESRDPANRLAPSGLPYVGALLRITISVGFTIIGLAFIFAAYLGVGLGLLDESLIVRYVLQLLCYFIPAIVVWAVAGICTVTHSRYVYIPRGTRLETPMMRTLFSVGAAGCVIMVLVVCARRLHDYEMIDSMNTASASELCAFYKKYQCTGFATNCTNSTSAMCSSCAPILGYSDACAPYVRNRVRLMLTPLLGFAGVMGVCVLLSVYLLWRLLVTVNAIGNHPHTEA